MFVDYFQNKSLNFILKLLHAEKQFLVDIPNYRVDINDYMYTFNKSNLFTKVYRVIICTQKKTKSFI